MIPRARRRELSRTQPIPPWDLERLIAATAAPEPMPPTLRSPPAAELLDLTEEAIALDLEET